MKSFLVVGLLSYVVAQGRAKGQVWGNLIVNINVGILIVKFLFFHSFLALNDKNYFLLCLRCRKSLEARKIA